MIILKDFENIKIDPRNIISKEEGKCITYDKKSSQNRLNGQCRWFLNKHELLKEVNYGRGM